MARFLALEWDLNEGRIVVAQSRGSRVTIEHAVAVALEPAGPSEPDPKLAEKISAALAARRSVGRCDTLVAVGRSSIELKQLTLPPAPDDELPDLVRFQAQREFNELADDWLLDYVPLDTAGDQPRNVLAAAISPELLTQVRSVCEAAGQKPERLMLRPLAAADHWRRRQPGSDSGVHMLIDLAPAEADLTVVLDGRAVFVRTARVRGLDILASPEDCRPLIGEVRRTMAAVQNQLGGRKVERITLYGAQPGYQALAGRIGTELSLPVALFDPLTDLDLGGDIPSGGPQWAGRFTALVAMCSAAAAEERPSLDFLHPRRRPKPPSRRRSQGLAVAAVALVVGAIGWTLYNGIASLDRQIAEQQAQLKQLDELATSAQQKIAKAEKIENWTRSEVIWLDELDKLARDLPTAEDAMVTQLIVGPHPEGALLQLEGVLRDSGSVSKLASGLRDDRHQVNIKGGQANDKHNRYKWRFNSMIVVAPSEIDAQTSVEAPSAATSDESPPAAAADPSPARTSNQPARGN